MNKTIKKILLILLVVIYAIPHLFITAIAGIIGLALIPLRSSNINRYMQTERYYIHIGSSKNFFPAEIKPTYKINDYLVSNRQLLGGDEIYLDVEYNDEDFASEINRLKEIYKDHHSLVKNVVIDDSTLFNYTTYITTYRPYYGEYEYACVDEDNKRIVYVYLEDESDPSIPVDFLPKNYKSDLYKENEYDYSIYVYP